jgi:hypothetical protein
MEPSPTVLATRLIDRARTSGPPRMKPRSSRATAASTPGWSSTAKMAGRRWAARAVLGWTQTTGCCGAMRAAGIRLDSKRAARRYAARVSRQAFAPSGGPLRAYGPVMAVASPRTNAHGADRVLPLGIALLAVVQLLIAVLIVLAPHWFFNNIGTFGAYNSHYVGDTAAFQAGLGAALAAAIVVPSLRPGALAAALATTGFHALNQ